MGLLGLGNAGCPALASTDGMRDADENVAETPETSNSEGFNGSDESNNDGSDRVIEEDDDPVEDQGNQRMNYASQAAGALILHKNPEMKGANYLLIEDNDHYALSPCNVKKFVTISLSEDVWLFLFLTGLPHQGSLFLCLQIHLDSVVITNEEKYSSSIEKVKLLGSEKYPVRVPQSCCLVFTYFFLSIILSIYLSIYLSIFLRCVFQTKDWLVLGEFTAANVQGAQTFLVRVLFPVSTVTRLTLILLH